METPVLRVLKASVVPVGALLRERRPGLIILIYHRVHGGTRSEIDLPVPLFARQMAYLQATYPIISLDSVADPAWEAVRGDRDVVAVTFDDGCREIYEHAFPILQEYRIPATVYLATQYVETQQAFDFGGYATSDRPPRPLTWRHLREMVDSGLVTVGAHTHAHADLSRLPVGEACEEINRSRSIIGDRLGILPRHFAYPWGAVTPTVRALVAEQFATAVRGGCRKNLFGAMDLLALWREPIQHSDGFALFKLKLRSYLDGEELFRSVAARVRAPRWRTGLDRT